MSLYDNDPRITRLAARTTWITAGGRYVVAEVGSRWDVYDLNVSDETPINPRGYNHEDEAIEALLGPPRSCGYQPGERVMASYENGQAIVPALVVGVDGDEVYVRCEGALSEDQLSVADVRPAPVESTC